MNFKDAVEFYHNDTDFMDVYKNEKLIFIILFRRLSNENFLTLFKLFALYTNSIISYLGTSSKVVIKRIH